MGLNPRAEILLLQDGTALFWEEGLHLTGACVHLMLSASAISMEVRFSPKDSSACDLCVSWCDHKVDSFTFNRMCKSIYQHCNVVGRSDAMVFGFCFILRLAEKKSVLSVRICQVSTPNSALKYYKAQVSTTKCDKCQLAMSQIMKQ